MPPGFGAIVGVTVLFFIALAAGTVLISVAQAYIALRVQDSRQPTPDPRLGLKLALHTLHTTAILIVLAGFSLLLMDLMDGVIGKRPAFGGPVRAQDDGLNTLRRVALALIGSGTLFAVIFWAFLLGTNDSEQRSVRRVFGGGRMALCLLITMFTVTALVAVLAQKEPDDRVTEQLLGMLLVWFPAAVIHMVLFFVNVNVRTTRRYREDEEDDRPWRPPGR